MFLLLKHTICNSSTIIKFLTTEPLFTRTYIVLSIYIIDDNDENPYYDDVIIKYMSHPFFPEFNNLIYL